MRFKVVQVENLAVVQWVKNLTAVAWATVEVQWIKGSGIATAVVQVAAAARIQSLAWELPHAASAAINKKRKIVQVKKKNNKIPRTSQNLFCHKTILNLRSVGKNCEQNPHHCQGFLSIQFQSKKKSINIFSPPLHLLHVEVPWPGSETTPHLTTHTTAVVTLIFNQLYHMGTSIKYLY